MLKSNPCIMTTKRLAQETMTENCHQNESFDSSCAHNIKTLNYLTTNSTSIKQKIKRTVKMMKDTESHLLRTGSGFNIFSLIAFKIKKSHTWHVAGYQFRHASETTCGEMFDARSVPRKPSSAFCMSILWSESSSAEN